MPRSSSRECLQQCFGLLQVGGVNALGAPAVDGCQQAASFGAFALLLLQAALAHGRPQLQRFPLLGAGDGEGATPTTFRLMCMSRPVTSRMPRASQVISLRPPGRRSGRQRASSSSPPRAGLSREPSAPHLLGIGWPPRPIPLPHDCIGRDPTALGHQRFAVAEAEAAGEPHPMARQLRWQPRVLLRAGCGWLVHAASMPPQPGAGRWAGSLDNAAAVGTPSAANIT
jgi:hypothetical protein